MAVLNTVLKFLEILINCQRIKIKQKKNKNIENRQRNSKNLWALQPQAAMDATFEIFHFLPEDFGGKKTEEWTGGGVGEGRGGGLRRGPWGATDCQSPLFHLFHIQAESSKISAPPPAVPPTPFYLLLLLLFDLNDILANRLTHFSNI